MNRQRGMTMVELMVSLAIVMLIIGAATTGYIKLLRTYKTQGRLAESYMANLTGLELLRYDVEMAGFGLPISLTAGVTYTEAAAQGANNPQPPYNPAGVALNDSTANAPRAFAQLNNAGKNGSDVLSIKSTAVNISPTSRKWSMITNPDGTPYVKRWGGAVSDPVLDFVANDRFVVLDNSYQLQIAVGNIGNNWCFTFSNSGQEFTNSSLVTPQLPDSTANNVYYVYGLDNTAGAHRMPFNRVDYYLNNIAADLPSSCAPNTMTLYRSTISQVDGTLQSSPLIDCVADFQVAFGLDTDLDGNVDTWAPTLGAMTALNIQQQLREVTVFLVYQEGLGATGKSGDYRSNGPLALGNANTGQLSVFTPNATQAQYRWKVIEMDMKPMNLIRTQ